MTNAIAIQTPFKPNGRNPPCSVKFANTIPLCEPKLTSSKIPTAMKTIMAVTFMDENQYSNSPNPPTPKAFIATTKTELATTQIHNGVSANHHWQYVATAVASPPMAIHCAAQYV